MVIIEDLRQKKSIVAIVDLGYMGLPLAVPLKENVPDIRNPHVIDILAELEEYGVPPIMHAPQADPAEARREYEREIKSLDAFRDIDAVLPAVAHREFTAIDAEAIRSMRGDNSPSKFFGTSRPCLMWASTCDV